MDYRREITSSVQIMKNGKMIENDTIQKYENPREKKMIRIHNGKPFVYLEKKNVFRPFLKQTPRKYVSFGDISSPFSLLPYRKPTPYPTKRKQPNLKKQSQSSSNTKRKREKNRQKK